MIINHKLAELEKMGQSIRVGLIGAGQMGRGMISQIAAMNGMNVVATADIRTEEAIKAYQNAGIDNNNIIVTEELEAAERAIENGDVVVTPHFPLVLALSSVDVIVDATGIPNLGAEIAWKSILAKKHIVMLNVETDVTVGPLLHNMAKAANVVYTGAAGDEPAAIMELYHFAQSVGFEVLVAGKGKNNPLNLHANPDTARKQAELENMNPKVLASFQDGTKTMIEMTAVANATGFLPDIPGMHGPESTVKQLTEILRLKEEGGILNRYHVVEYINGIAPGVFVIVTSDQPEVHRELKYLKMGSGPNYVLYRPYHLTSLETPISVAKAYLAHEESIVPYHGLVAETVAIAKKDLQPGDSLDGLGGFTAYGQIMTATEAKESNALPIGLTDSSLVMTKPVKQGEPITFDAVEQTKDLTIWQLRNLMER
ncbi:Predicted homoserine dehydrogenase, contains C-terminal SAF domain [Seinonella peptonophila]|uniref:Predicted homoserine dehydrogenase, contains C-terminal SAF domain n=1 Tax=Seinonella peptonophila TaxID=112248 RepID=A0A1M4WCU3_9BACL|nr:NAD(P)-binding domain-containing protein [Seinonella peptonophila]SHE79078.1 Predicted homoserine dehydrogenase, contains C-terminal SAF domain [Seinonella peptonophila]